MHWTHCSRILLPIHSDNGRSLRLRDMRIASSGRFAVYIPRMSHAFRSAIRIVWLALPLVLVAGCTPVFNARAAQEVSRDKLLWLAEKGQADKLKYVGSDNGYHYVFDSREGAERSYKVRADAIKLKDVFPVGDEEGYVLYPWVIEGSRFGTRPREILKEEEKIAADRAAGKSGWRRPSDRPEDPIVSPTAPEESGLPDGNSEPN